METPKLLILLCCIYNSYASHHHHSHTIPVEGYETELQNLGQHVEIPETPVKVIKITKTIAVKVPVPYPVKVIEKVPYPVHISKPYPVPVPQIVHVPAPSHKHSGDNHNEHNSHQGQDKHSYQVQEGPHESSDRHSSGPSLEHSYNGGSSDNNHNIESFADEYPSEEGSYGGSSFDAPSHSYYGNNGNQEGSNAFESESYDKAIQDYLHKLNPSVGSHGGDANGVGGYHY